MLCKYFQTKEQMVRTIVKELTSHIRSKHKPNFPLIYFLVHIYIYIYIYIIDIIADYWYSGGKKNTTVVLLVFLPRWPTSDFWLDLPPHHIKSGDFSERNCTPNRLGQFSEASRAGCMGLYLHFSSSLPCRNCYGE